MTASSPNAAPLDEGRLFHRRLLDGDPTATAEIVAAFLDPLITWLCSHNRRVDEHLCISAAGEAIISLLKNPRGYDPAKLALDAYLRMAAGCDLRNALARECRHRHRSLASVEHSTEAGNQLGRDDDPSLPLRIAEECTAACAPPAFHDRLTPEEARAWELMCSGERRSQEFARVLGLGHLPKAERARAVKRVKDRLKKRKQRREDGRAEPSG